MAIEPSKDFVDVERTFFKVDGTKPIKADEVEAWSRWGGSTHWVDLRALRRVVVLAEANSGKTQEFRNQVWQINRDGGYAFFLAIESLARNSFGRALGPDQNEKFRKWDAHTAEGYFFLDSLDEAKLNNLSLQDALRNLREALGGAYERAHLIISSRGTDWDGEEDLADILECFPPTADRVEEFESDEDEALVSALRKVDRSGNQNQRRKDAENAVGVFAMARLTYEQRTQFLAAKKLTDIDHFEKVLFRRGLTSMAERPGDLAMLLAYWRREGKFSSLRDMMEFSIERRLSEKDDRRDASILTNREARLGAERLAAALTLGRKLTILSKRINEVADDAVDPATVLSDWPADKRKALLRRGIFAPSTFGRVRFHHRSVIEYLTASWFLRILKGPRSPAREIVDIFVGRGFDTETIPPSLRPAAAWLALEFPELRELLVERDPLALFAYGDPSVLPIAVRERLLRRYADRDNAASLGDLRIDAHALWMFSDPKLAGALEEAWENNIHSDFRFELLRLIELGKLAACSDLARVEALDHRARYENRILGARALQATSDLAGLKLLAKDLKKNAKKYGARLAPDLAQSVFPDALSVRELLRVIALSPPARQFQVEGFGYALDPLFAACRTPSERIALLLGLVKLGDERPFVEYHHVSARHYELIKHLAPLLRRAIAASDTDGLSDGLVGLLSLCGRADVDESVERGQPLRDLINARRALKRRLFWEDARREFAAEPSSISHPFVWWLQTPGRRLWRLDADDFQWLADDADAAESEPLQRLAFSAAYDVARAIPGKLAELKSRFSAVPVLLADLADFQVPRKESDFEQRMRQRNEATETARAAKLESDAAGWKKFRGELRADLGRLNDPKRIVGWPGASDLYCLTTWLALKTGRDRTTAAKEHRKLIAAFGPQVHEAYQRGMEHLWRHTTPSRPFGNPSGGTSIHKTAQLSVAGVNMESTSEGWMLSLSPAMAQRAIEHAVFTERDAPEWFEKFIQAAPKEALDVVVNEIRDEWGRPSSVPASFLSRFQHSVPAPAYLRTMFLDLIGTVEVADPGRVTGFNYLISRLGLTDSERNDLAQIVRKRLDAYRAAKEWEWTATYAGVYFNLALEDAAELLPTLLDEQPSEVRRERTIGLIGSLFSMSSGIVTSLSRGDAKSLKKLLLMAYERVSPSEDQRHEGIHSSDERDDAQDGRSRILSSLMGLGTAEAYQALLSLADNRVIGDRGRRFKQLAAGLAEEASEKPVWSGKQVEVFEETHLSPVRTGGELLKLACAVIDDLDTEFRTWDYSIKPLVETAKDEFAIQNWLAREFERLSNGRYLTAREKQVKNERRPDLALSVGITGSEVAIEIKHGEKSWTLPELKYSISNQLAHDYLLPPKRRAGLFVITNHRDTRYWFSEDKTQRLDFRTVVKELTDYAASITSNAEGFIELAVRGLDASGGPARPRSKTNKRSKRAGKRGAKVRTRTKKARSATTSRKKIKRPSKKRR